MENDCHMAIGLLHTTHGEQWKRRPVVNQSAASSVEVGCLAVVEHNNLGIGTDFNGFQEIS